MEKCKRVYEMKFTSGSHAPLTPRLLLAVFLPCLPPESSGGVCARPAASQIANSPSTLCHRPLRRCSDISQLQGPPSNAKLAGQPPSTANRKSEFKKADLHN